MRFGLFTPVFRDMTLDSMLAALKRYPAIEMPELGTRGWPGSDHH
jgi:hypothetical protein